MEYIITTDPTPGSAEVTASEDGQNRASAIHRAYSILLLTTSQQMAESQRPSRGEPPHDVRLISALLTRKQVIRGHMFGSEKEEGLLQTHSASLLLASG